VGLPLYFLGFFGLYIPEYAINKYILPSIFRVAKGSIDTFIAAIAANGGMAMSNGYDVEFDFGNLGDRQLRDRFTSIGISLPSANDSGTPGALINMFCDEAQLPNSQAATGQINGRYLGEGTINYPHTRMVSDFSLTWMCDANMIPYKFINTWHSFIFGNIISSKSPQELRNFKASASADPTNRTTRLKYPNQYQGTLRIAKTEKGKNAPNSRVSLVYVMENVYPYSIDAVPLSYGSSQITRVSANFYYTRHTVYNADIRRFDG
jgi:hypothetical protein